MRPKAFDKMPFNAVAMMALITMLALIAAAVATGNLALLAQLAFPVTIASVAVAGFAALNKGLAHPADVTDAVAKRVEPKGHTNEPAKANAPSQVNTRALAAGLTLVTAAAITTGLGILPLAGPLLLVGGASLAAAVAKPVLTRAKAAFLKTFTPATPTADSKPQIAQEPVLAPAHDPYAQAGIPQPTLATAPHVANETHPQAAVPNANDRILAAFQRDLTPATGPAADPNDRILAAFQRDLTPPPAPTAAPSAPPTQGSTPAAVPPPSPTLAPSPAPATTPPVAPASPQPPTQSPRPPVPTL